MAYARMLALAACARSSLSGAVQVLDQAEIGPHVRACVKSKRLALAEIRTLQAEAADLWLGEMCRAAWRGQRAAGSWSASVVVLAWWLGGQEVRVAGVGMRGAQA